MKTDKPMNKPETREIKFRGKSKIHPFGWLYGDLCQQDFAHDALIGVWNDKHRECEWHSVDPETVGQFTGLHDKNGKEIYEGDICTRYHLTGVVAWHTERAMWILQDGFNDTLFHDISGIEITGNIYN